ncbi:hypothetical protein V8E36_007281 [Tilletia maclaganii]
MPSAPTSATAYRSHMQNGSVALSAPYYEFSTSVSASPSGPPSGSTTDHLGNHIFIDIGTRSTASPSAPKPAPRGYDARVAANASASGDEEDSASAAGRFAPTTRGPAANSAPAPIVSQAPLVFGLDYAANDATLSIPGSKFPSCIIPFGASNHASTILGASAIRPLPGTQGKLTSPGPRTAL